MKVKMKIIPNLIVSDNAALIEVAHICGAPTTTPAISHVKDPFQLLNKIVLGDLPIHLAALTKAIIQPRFQNLESPIPKNISATQLLDHLAGWNVFTVKRRYRRVRGTANTSKQRKLATPTIVQTSRKVYKRGVGWTYEIEWQVRQNRKILAIFHSENEAQTYLETFDETHSTNLNKTS